MEEVDIIDECASVVVSVVDSSEQGTAVSVTPQKPASNNKMRLTHRQGVGGENTFYKTTNSKLDGKSRRLMRKAGDVRGIINHISAPITLSLISTRY